MKHFIVLAASIVAVLGYATQSLAGPDPADPNSTIPAQPYRSPFADYKPLGEDKLLPWKAVNDEVGRIGGWRVYAKEAADGKADPAATPAGKPTAPPVSTPAADPAAKKPAMDHSDHAKHK